MKTTLQEIWYLTESGKVYTDTTTNYFDWKEAHSSALFKILRAVKAGAKIEVNYQDAVDADFSAIYGEGFTCHYIMKTTEE